VPGHVLSGLSSAQHNSVVSLHIGHWGYLLLTLPLLPGEPQPAVEFGQYLG
jgi:hypothetical protein